jgi:hypothetical protein
MNRVIVIAALAGALAGAASGVGAAYVMWPRSTQAQAPAQPSRADSCRALRTQIGQSHDAAFSFLVTQWNRADCATVLEQAGEYIAPTPTPRAR